MGTAEVQGALWGAAADVWSELVEPLSAPLFETVLEAVGVGAGTKLLDAGCGSGLALQIARERGAAVSGLDASAALLEVARRRVPDGDVRRGELEELPFESNTFAPSPRSTRCSTRRRRWVRCGRSRGSRASGRRSPSSRGRHPSGARRAWCWRPSVRCSRRPHRA